MSRATLAILLVCAACAQPARPATRRVISSPVVTPAVTAVAAPARSPRPRPTPRPTPIPVVKVRYRVDVRVADAPEFASILQATMSDPRGWIRAGFDVREDPSAPYVVVLAEGAEVDALCLPYDTYGEYSCQNGGVVALNAERWREAVPHWSDLNAYRQMMLNHEMGHLLGQRHRQCAAGRPAPVMYQQSSRLRGCLHNPWPLPDEIALAARHDLKLAPGFGE